jgi:hypothetical protein
LDGFSGSTTALPIALNEVHMLSMGIPGMFHIGTKLLSLVKRTIWPVRQVYMNRNQSSARGQAEGAAAEQSKLERNIMT